MLAAWPPGGLTSALFPVWQMLVAGTLGLALDRAVGR